MREMREAVIKLDLLNFQLLNIRNEMSRAILNAPIEQLVVLVKPTEADNHIQDLLELKKQDQAARDKEIEEGLKKQAEERVEKPKKEEQPIEVCRYCGYWRPSGPGPCPVCNDVVVGLKKEVEVELAIKEDRFAKKEMETPKCPTCGHAHPCLCDTSKLAMAKSPAKQVEKSDHCSLLPTIILFGGNREHELKMMKEEMPDANWRLISSRDGRMFSEMSYDWVVINAMIVPPGAMDYAKKRIPTGRSVCWNGTKRDMERCCGWLREKIKANTKPVRE